MNNKLIIAVAVTLLTLMMPYESYTQNHLEVEGDAWVRDRLIINSTAPGGGEYIENPTGLDLRFYTGFLEQMRIKTSLEGGGMQIFAMDTITSMQDTMAGNVVRLSDGTLALRQYKVGDMAQGGIVFWVDETGEHGLVSSPDDLVSTSGDLIHQWSTVYEVTAATGDGVGAGAMNTMLITTAEREDEDSAARLCADLEEGGYGDWYLPSKHELDLMYNNLHVVGLGNFAPVLYWSSTELSFDTIAGRQDFDDGFQGNGDKDDLERVRAIRAF